MFEIDLKNSAEQPTHGERPAAGDEPPYRELAPIAVALVAMLLILWFVNSRIDSGLEERRAVVAGREATVTAKRQELAEVSGKRRAVIGVQNAEVYWSDVLRMFSELTPDKLWISELRIVSSGGGKEGEPVVHSLRVQGGVLSAESEGNLDLIARYIQTLETDPRYAQHFGAAKLGPVNRAGKDDHALAFDLAIPFRPAA